jgi:hypothetical protein
MFATLPAGLIFLGFCTLNVYEDNLHITKPLIAGMPHPSAPFSLSYIQIFSLALIVQTSYIYIFSQVDRLQFHINWKQFKTI